MSIEGIIGLVLVILGASLGWFVRGKKAGSDQAKAVTQAKSDTETQVRTQVASEAQVSAQQAQAEAVLVRAQAEQVADAVSTQGDDALNDELRKQGMLRE